MNLVQVANLYPDNFGNFLVAKALGVSIAATGDCTVAGSAGMGIPYAQVRIRRVTVVVPPAAAGGIDVSGGALAFFDAAGGTGNTIVSNATLTGLSAAGIFVDMTMATAANNTVITTGRLFPRVGTGVASGLVDIYVYGDIIGARA